MNRKSFLAELRSLLAFLDAGERERVLNRYERMFDEAGPEGESAVIRCFGSPVRQVLQIEREYRDALAAGETPFADGVPAEPETSDEPAEELPEEEPEFSAKEIPGEEVYVEEAYAETGTEAEEGFAAEEETAEPETEMPVPEEAAELSAAAALTGLPELDLGDLDLPELELDLPEEPAAAEEAAEEEIVLIEEEAVAPVQPEEPVSESEETAQPEESASETVDEVRPEEPAAETGEPAQSAEPVSDEPEEEIRIAEETVSVFPEESAAEILPQQESVPADEPYADEPYEEAPQDAAEENGKYPEEYEETGETGEYEAVSERPPVSGGRAFAAVMVTIPMLVLWALLFGLSLGLGIAVLAIGAALGVAGVYIAGYVFNGSITYMPDLLLTAGAALAALALALLLVWSGLSIAISGCSATVRLTRNIYRSILYPKKGDDRNE